MAASVSGFSSEYRLLLRSGSRLVLCFELDVDVDVDVDEMCERRRVASLPASSILQ